MAIGAVMEGTFQYRTTTGAALLAPGSLLLGNHGASFECGHEHGTGDRCLAFCFAPELMEAVAGAVPGARRIAFAAPHLPPLASLVPLLAQAEAAREDGDPAEIEELALRLAGAVASTLAGTRHPAARTSARDERRISEVAAAHRGRGNGVALPRRPRPRGGHEPLPLPAHLPPGHRPDPLPVHPACAAQQGRGTPAEVGRVRLGHRLRCRLRRPVDLQPPLPATDGLHPGRLPRRTQTRGGSSHPGCHGLIGPAPTAPRCLNFSGTITATRAMCRVHDSQARRRLAQWVTAVRALRRELPASSQCVRRRGTVR